MQKETQKTEASNNAILTNLPMEVLALIASFLQKSDLLNFRSVNRLFKFASGDLFLEKLVASKMIAQIACGSDASYMLKADGTLYAWGTNKKGQLGLGHNNDCLLPQKVSNLKNIKRIAVGGDSVNGSHCLALTKDGTLYGWGSNNSCVLGLPGLPLNFYNTPQVLFNLNSITSIATGSNHSFALSKDGILYAWGDNACGQLGSGHNKYYASELVVCNLKGDIKRIVAGDSHTIVLMKDGTVRTCGYNYFGQLGLGHNNDCSTLQVVPNLNKIKDITTGRHHCFALSEDGTLYAWGYNEYGQLGLGDNNDRNAPQPVSKLINVAIIIAGSEYSLAVTHDNLLYTWGRNDLFQLGFSHKRDCNTPQMVYEFPQSKLKDVIRISGGYAHSLALTENGSLYGWGWNIGQLGSIKMNSNIKITTLDKVLQLNGPKIIKDILESESKNQESPLHKRNLNTKVTQETKQALINQLCGLANNSLLSFFNSQATTLAQELKSFIEVKENTIGSIKNEIKSYRDKNQGLGNIQFQTCLDSLDRILNNALEESINNELLKKIDYGQGV